MFRIEIPGGDDVKASIREKMAIVKSLVDKQSVCVNNADVLNLALDEYINSHTTNAAKVIPDKANPYLRVDREEVDQPVFLTTLHSVDKLTRLVADHVRTCPSATSHTEE